jgi:CheY-like chemotaxis protein
MNPASAHATHGEPVAVTPVEPTIDGSKEPDVAPASARGSPPDELDRAAHTKRPSPRRNPMMPRKEHPVVLVAEDDAATRHALVTRLSQAGFEVVTAADGDSAISLLKARHTDAAVLDVNMPATDGFGVCEFIRRDRTCRDIPVVFLTGAETGLLRDHLGRLSQCVGGDLHLTKPYDGKLLTAMLWDAIGKRGAGPARRAPEVIEPAPAPPS